MGLPAFKLTDLLKEHSIEVYSSNYTLYGDLSARVMTTLTQWTPDVEVYSEAVTGGVREHIASQ